jgi:CheY-like chemotaxis protein
MIDIDDPGLSTILVLDDNPAALYVKSWLLSRRGYRVLEAANGTEALTIAKAALPDRTLLDTTLSDISGFDVCHRL